MFKNGEVYICNLDGLGSEQCGNRPVVIVSNAKVCLYSPTLQVIPLSKKVGKACHLPTHFMLYKKIYDFLYYDSIALGESITTVDKQRLGNRLGSINLEHLNHIVDNMKKTFV